MSVTPEEVLKFTKPTDGYLCKSSANIYGIDFIYFRIRDTDSGSVIFEIRKPEPPPGTVYAEPDDNDDSWRCIRYQFPKQFLSYKNIGTTLEFKVGDKPVPHFRMIERHYFREHLIQSYDFDFGFCIPNSVNSWESFYPMPELDSSIVAAMIANPFETKSDSFYFVNDQLVMHNKGEYSYV
eukprot:EC722470.1.p1 GENE.EC722470.1~~EC722470.1.p1  ORF type:complete len:181 (+),score=16.81 EC722470.1:29-571(+)